MDPVKYLIDLHDKYDSTQIKNMLTYISCLNKSKNVILYYLIKSNSNSHVDEKKKGLQMIEKILDWIIKNPLCVGRNNNCDYNYNYKELIPIIENIVNEIEEAYTIISSIKPFFDNYELKTYIKDIKNNIKIKEKSTQSTFKTNINNVLENIISKYKSKNKEFEWEGGEHVIKKEFQSIEDNDYYVSNDNIQKLHGLFYDITKNKNSMSINDFIDYCNSLKEEKNKTLNMKIDNYNLTKHFNTYDIDANQMIDFEEFVLMCFDNVKESKPLQDPVSENQTTDDATKPTESNTQDHQECYTRSNEPTSGWDKYYVNDLKEPSEIIFRKCKEKFKELKKSYTDVNVILTDDQKKNILTELNNLSKEMHKARKEENVTNNTYFTLPVPIDYQYYQDYLKFDEEFREKIDKFRTIFITSEPKKAYYIQYIHF